MFVATFDSMLSFCVIRNQDPRWSEGVGPCREENDLEFSES